MNIIIIIEIQISLCNYNELQRKYLLSKSVIRNKTFLMKKFNKTITIKNNKHMAIKTYNILPNELKFFT